VRDAIISESFLPTVSGVTTSVCRVLEHLAAHGHDALIIAPAGAPAVYAGFPVHTVPAVAYRQFPVGVPSPQVQRLLAAFRPDVLHAASPFLLGAQGIAAANRLGGPAVAVFQTDVAGYARRNRLGSASRLAWRLVKWVHDGADLTLVPSTASMGDVQRAGLTRLDFWARGVDLDGFHPNRRDDPAAALLRDRLSPDGETVIGYVGRIAPEKQVERMRALRGISGIRLAIVGDGPSLPAVQRELSGMPVTWLGRLTGARCGTRTPASTFSCMPAPRRRSARPSRRRTPPGCRWWPRAQEARSTSSTMAATGSCSDLTTTRICVTGRPS
jgi:phosphatidylinositol alpha 1,6-mannosyltransferase